MYLKLKVLRKIYNLNIKYKIINLSSEFDLKLEDILVIGYDVAHPPPINAQERRLLKTKGISVDSFDPSVVGVCAIF